MSAPMPESGIEALAILYEQAKSRLLAAEERANEYRREWESALERNNAAEARVREVEAEMDARRERKVALMECEEREATLRAERDALVAEVVRYKELLLTMEMPDA